MGAKTRGYTPGDTPVDDRKKNLKQKSLLDLHYGSGSHAG